MLGVNAGPEWLRMLDLARAEARQRAGFVLKPLQEQVLFHLGHGRSVFAGFPTGFGKSVCYWMPAAAWGWRVWIVSPLVSLMEDQVLAARKVGLRAITFSENRKDLPVFHRLLESRNWDLCFLSPERLAIWERRGYLARLRTMQAMPDLVAIDEMHCLEDWRQFRPAYNELFESFRKWLGRDSLLLGLSASMSVADSSAWMNELADDYERLDLDIGRPNLHLQVLPLETEDLRWLLVVSALRNLAAPSSALLYCCTRREADDLARWLLSCGFPAAAYHAGLPSSIRKARSKAFRDGALRIVCATSAFGMGIDYPYVDRVIHFSMPYDLESYWQEVGRAGRSGGEASGLAFWRRSEVYRLLELKDTGQRERFAALWRSWLGGKCRKRVVAARLGLPDSDCGNCDRCRPDFFPLVDPGLKQPWWTEGAGGLGEWFEEKLKLLLLGRDASEVPSTQMVTGRELL